ncbi:MAG: flippase [Candidatus Bathyarchaeota archaeon]|nr:flippase [Candidatus Bathyarchaeota archaeon]
MTSNFADLIKNSAKGSLVLVIGQAITTIISALTIIWIARIIGPTNYGEYTVALVPTSLLLLLQDLGINQALMRFCSMYRYEERTGLRSIVLTGLLFSGVTSLILSVFLYVFSNIVASLYLQRPELTTLVQAASLAILGNGLFSTVQAILAGYELMSLRSITQILYSALRGIFGIVLLIIGMGTFGAIFSYTLSMFLTAIVGMLLIFTYIKFNKEDGAISLKTLKMLLSFGFPLSIGTIVGGVLSQVYNSLIIIYASTDMIGNYGAAMNFGVLLTFITVPITIVLFPLFSKFKKDDPQLKILYRSSVKYTSIITLPVVLVIILLASPLSHVIYTTEYPLVPLYLSLYILSFAFEGLGGLSLINLISGIGESKVLFNSSLASFAAGIITALILIPKFQIVGLLITVLIAQRVGWLYQIIWARKNLTFTIDWASTIRIYATGLAAFIVSYSLINLLKLQEWVALVSGGATFLLIYLISLPLSGSLNRVDIEQLEAITGTMGPLKPLLKILIRILRIRIKNT